MKLGVSGHRWRDGADWIWVRERLTDHIRAAGEVEGYTSLAPGADQIFAEIILADKRELVVVIPVFGGHAELEIGAKPEFDRFCRQAGRTIKISGDTADAAFMAAGVFVVDECDQMIFVWDGKPSRGLGGTADVVAYARKQRKAGIILDPIGRATTEL